MFVSYRSSFEDVKKFHSEVEGAAVRLEELLLQKKKKIMQAARVNALEAETHEVTIISRDNIMYTLYFCIVYLRIIIILCLGRLRRVFEFSPIVYLYLPTYNSDNDNIIINIRSLAQNPVISKSSS